MLIKGKRALAYTAKCGAIKPIEGADNIELMAVNGWNVIVKKGEFKEGDYCVYFEIDSKVPEIECFEFLRKYNKEGSDIVEADIDNNGAYGHHCANACGFNTLKRIHKGVGYSKNQICPANNL